MNSNLRLRTLTLSLAACILYAPAATAALVSFSGFSSDGHPVSGSADFTLNAGADTVTVKLTNTTKLTLDAGELFTGLDFSLGGLTPTMASTADTGFERSVNGAGGFVDSGGIVNLTWSLVPIGSGVYQLNFNPNAKHAIIGPPTAGSYALANGSIKSNPGHDPFAAEMATFVLSVPGLEASTPVVVRSWRFGTELDPAFVPEPTTTALAVIGLAAAGWTRRRRG